MCGEEAASIFYDKEEMGRMLASAKLAAHKAGSFIKEAKDTASIVEMSRRDIKLDLDRKAEEIIVSSLATKFPILCEETGWIGDMSSGYWVVDGLDGTVNLYYGIPMASVSIGFVYDDQPVIGVVYDFIHDEMFSGMVGDGVAVNERSVEVSRTDSVDQALLLTALATKGNFDSSTLSEFGQRLGQWRKVRMLGSAALSLAYVASGRADACEITNIMEWDVMAGLALVRAAGGSISAKPLGSDMLDIYASNGLIAAE